jgi:hypothetical protein
MTLIKYLLIVYGALALFGPRAVVLCLIGYLIIYSMGSGLNRLLDNEGMNRIGFGVFCSFAIIAIIWMIQKG